MPDLLGTRCSIALVAIGDLCVGCGLWIVRVIGACDRLVSPCQPAHSDATALAIRMPVDCYQILPLDSAGKVLYQERYVHCMTQEVTEDIIDQLPTTTTESALETASVRAPR